MSGSTVLAIERYVSWQLTRLLSMPESSATRAALANLRRGAGKLPGSVPAVWNYTLEGLGDKHPEWLSRDGQATAEEWAIHQAMTFFALHQQGKKWKNAENGSHPGAMHQPEKEYRLGRSLAKLIQNEDDFVRVKRRFDALVTANSINELAHHLRSMVTLLAGKDIPLDYAHLAADLYAFQIPWLRDRVRLIWGQDFYWKEKLSNEDLIESEEK